MCVDTYTERKVKVEMKCKPGLPRILYNSELPLNLNKYNDLMRMCSKNIILEMYHSNFKVLQTNPSIQDEFFIYFLLFIYSSNHFKYNLFT